VPIFFKKTTGFEVTAFNIAGMDVPQVKAMVDLWNIDGGSNERNDNAHVFLTFGDPLSAVLLHGKSSRSENESEGTCPARASSCG
jgi:hypothetical protein